MTPLAAAGAPTFVKVSAEQVAFQPDSTTFLDEAAARAALNGLAEQLKEAASGHYIVLAAPHRWTTPAGRAHRHCLLLALGQYVTCWWWPAFRPTRSPAWVWATSRRACVVQTRPKTAASMCLVRQRTGHGVPLGGADRELTGKKTGHPGTECSVPGCLFVCEGGDAPADLAHGERAFALGRTDSFRKSTFILAESMIYFMTELVR